MQKNVGAQDKKIRYIVGVVMFLLGLYYGSWLFTILGLVIVVTAYIGFCGLYKIFGINTCPVKPVASPMASPTVSEPKKNDQQNIQ